MSSGPPTAPRRAPIRSRKSIPLASSYPYQFTAVGNRVFFVADDGTHSNELWVSDGTDAGTQLVRDISTTTDNSATPRYLTASAGNLFFSGDDGSGRELWHTFPFTPPPSTGPPPATPAPVTPAKKKCKKKKHRAAAAKKCKKKK